MKHIQILKFLFGLLLIASCAKPDEKELIPDEKILPDISPAYADLYGTFGNADNIMPLQEVTTDEMVVPTRGADWGDGGHWARLKTHTYTPNDPRPKNTWNFLFKGVNTCNKLLDTLEPIGTAASKGYISELKALRAIYYYWLLDLFGNVPIVTDFTQTELPASKTRNELYDFVEKELYCGQRN